MTKEEILAMEKGISLDIVVHEKVQGWEIDLDAEPSNMYERMTGNPYGWKRGAEKCRRPLSYSTDISAAWQVVKKLTEQNLFCSLDYLREQHHRDGRGDWRCRVVCGVKIEFAVAKEEPEAICKAALLAKLERYAYLDNVKWDRYETME